MLRWATTHTPLIEWLTSATTVLEVGTGTGMLSAFSSRTARNVVTLDNSGGVLTTAGRFFDTVDAPVRRVAGDAFRLPFRDRSFDVAFSQGLLEHFSDEAVRAIVREQSRVATRVIASVPTLWYPHLGHLGPGLIGNERLMTKRRWERLLGGFKVRAHYYADPKVATLAGFTVPLPVQLLLVVE
jgi:SAM-dependent methyltransferase